MKHVDSLIQRRIRADIQEERASGRSSHKTISLLKRESVRRERRSAKGLTEDYFNYRE
jgi:hypothetical protein